MPNDEHQRSFVAPPQWTGECNEWCAGLHLIERELTDHPDIGWYDVADFMVMGALRRPDLPLLYLYKHIDTRRYLNIDANGGPWRYVPPARGEDGEGHYVRHRSLEAALDDLFLWQMDDVPEDDEDDDDDDVWVDGEL